MWQCPRYLFVFLVLVGRNNMLVTKEAHSRNAKEAAWTIGPWRIEDTAEAEEQDRGEKMTKLTGEINRTSQMESAWADLQLHKNRWLQKPF